MTCKYKHTRNTLQWKILGNNWPYGDRTGFAFSMQTVLDTTTSFGWTSLDGSMWRTSTPWLRASRLSTLPRVLLSSSSSSRLTCHNKQMYLYTAKVWPGDVNNLHFYIKLSRNSICALIRNRILYCNFSLTILNFYCHSVHSMLNSNSELLRLQNVQPSIYWGYKKKQKKIWFLQNKIRFSSHFKWLFLK